MISSFIDFTAKQENPERAKFQVALSKLIISQAMIKKLKDLSLDNIDIELARPIHNENFKTYIEALNEKPDLNTIKKFFAAGADSSYGGQGGSALEFCETRNYFEATLLILQQENGKPNLVLNFGSALGIAKAYQAKAGNPKEIKDLLLAGEYFLKAANLELKKGLPEYINFVEYYGVSLNDNPAYSALIKPFIDFARLQTGDARLECEIALSKLAYHDDIAQQIKDQFRIDTLYQAKNPKTQFELRCTLLAEFLEMSDLTLELKIVAFQISEDLKKGAKNPSDADFVKMLSDKFNKAENEGDFCRGLSDEKNKKDVIEVLEKMDTPLARAFLIDHYAASYMERSIEVLEKMLENSKPGFFNGKANVNSVNRLTASEIAICQCLALKWHSGSSKKFFELTSSKVDKVCSPALESATISYLYGRCLKENYFFRKHDKKLAASRFLAAAEKFIEMYFYVKRRDFLENGLDSLNESRWIGGLRSTSDFREQLYKFQWSQDEIILIENSWPMERRFIPSTPQKVQKKEDEQDFQLLGQTSSEGIRLSILQAIFAPNEHQRLNFLNCAAQMNPLVFSQVVVENVKSAISLPDEVKQIMLTCAKDVLSNQLIVGKNYEELLKVFEAVSSQLAELIALSSPAPSAPPALNSSAFFSPPPYNTVLENLSKYPEEMPYDK